MYLILKFWTTNTCKLGKYSEETVTKLPHVFKILQRTWHWPEWQGSRQEGFSQVHRVRGLILVRICGSKASQRFVVPIPSSSGLSQEHTAIKAPGSAVSCWHSRRDSGPSSHPRLQAAHVPQHPIAPIPPRAIKLTYLSVFQPVCSQIPSSFQRLFLFLSATKQRLPESEHQPQDPQQKAFSILGIPAALLEASSSTSLLQRPERERHNLSAELSWELWTSHLTPSFTKSFQPQRKTGWSLWEGEASFICTKTSHLPEWK